MGRPKIEGICSVEGCGKPRDSLGLCTEHYYRQWKFGRLEKVNTGLKRSHPLYIMWHERKQTNSLAPEWMDFWDFVKGVGERPTPRHFLVRFNPEPFGPDNFCWKEFQQRQPGESKKDWYARKWASQQVMHPMRERKRDLYRRFGLSVEQYDVMWKAQKGKCAICGQSETAIEPKTGSVKRLAIDHCHTTNKIRDLLCWRCNSALGRVGESIDLLKKMISYIRKHE